MSDELVQRLRYLSRVFRRHDVEDLTYDDYLSAQLYPDEAADRIEQLERELSISRMAQVVMDNSVAEVEALTAQLESTLQDRKLILEDRDRLRRGIEYILDGYGLAGPDYRFPYGEEESDWINAHLIAVMKGERHE